MSKTLNIVGMTDEEFKKLNGPPVVEADDEGHQEDPFIDEENVEEQEEEENDDVSEQEDNETSDEKGAGENGSDEEDDEKGNEEDDDVDYKSLYLTLIAPIAANGKEIEIRSPEEARQLMSAGANYTKKMMELAPQRKILRMLETNNLLDESKISFLIDIDNKDPEAIRKLLREGEIDPLSVDPSDEGTYSGVSKAPSDKELVFVDTWEDIGNRPNGEKALEELKLMDQESKSKFWENPEAMVTIYEQIESGVYQKIRAEIERRSALGQIPPNRPFLENYVLVGNELFSSPQNNQNQGGNGKAPEGKKLDSRPAKKSSQDNDDKAKAASLRGGNGGGKDDKAPKNFIGMSDDEFREYAKTFKGRL